MEATGSGKVWVDNIYFDHYSDLGVQKLMLKVLLICGVSCINSFMGFFSCILCLMSFFFCILNFVLLFLEWILLHCMHAYKGFKFHGFLAFFLSFSLSLEVLSLWDVAFSCLQACIYGLRWLGALVSVFPALFLYIFLPPVVENIALNAIRPLNPRTQSHDSRTHTPPWTFFFVSRYSPLHSIPYPAPFSVLHPPPFTVPHLFSVHHRSVFLILRSLSHQPVQCSSPSAVSLSSLTVVDHRLSPLDHQHRLPPLDHDDDPSLIYHDNVRTEAYKTAVKHHQRFIEGKVVLDVGCGTGILSLFCAQAGAKRVYAVDASEIAVQARKVVEENNFSDIITVLHGRVEDVQLDEEVDVIISEWMGNMLLQESMLGSVIIARERWLKPEGLILPSNAKLYMAPFTDNERYCDAINFWRDVHGFDMSALIPLEKTQSFGSPWIETIEVDNLLGSSHIHHCMVLHFGLMFSLLELQLLLMKHRFCPPRHKTRQHTGSRRCYTVMMIR